MKRSSILLTSLFLISATSHTMEITDQSFDSSPKKPSFCFLDLEDSNRSFANYELLWMREMNDNKLLNPDIINDILKIRYCQIINNPSFKLSTMDFNCKYFKAVFWLNKGQQIAFNYLYSKAPRDNENHFVITGANKEFLKKLIKHIDSFPILLKQVLRKYSNNSFYIQTSEPILNNLLGKGESRIGNVNTLATAAGFLTSVMLFSFSSYICSKIDNEHFRQGLYMGGIITLFCVMWMLAMGEEEEMFEQLSLGVNTAIIMSLIGISAKGIFEVLIGIGMKDDQQILLLTLGTLVLEVLAAIQVNAGTYMKSYIQNSLIPVNLDDEMTLCGFEKRFFFPEQKDEI